MIYLNSGILLLVIILYLFTGKSEEPVQDLNKKEHKLYLLYPMSGWIINKTGLEKRLYRKENITNSIKALYITSKPESIRKLYWCGKLSMVIFLIFIFNLFSLLISLQPENVSILTEGRYLERPRHGQGTDSVNLKVIIEALGDRNKDAGSYIEDVTVPVKERKYSREELDRVMENAIQYLDQAVLGNNTDPGHIEQDLNFCDSIPGTGIMVGWKPENAKIIGLDGSVKNDEMKSSGIDTRVRAILNYEGEEFEHEYEFHIMPRHYSEEEILTRKLSEEIAEATNTNREDSRMELPGQLEEYRLSWKEQEMADDPTIILFGILLAALTWFYGDKELEQKMKKRKEQLLLDYPDIINKFTLLVNAGMTVKQAWSKIAHDYEQKTAAGQTRKRFAYEEMLVTVRELGLGIAEGDAYEQFGRRISLLPYMKFSSLISQNLKKGSKGLSELLTREAMEAFKERKDTAKRLGEEAGTKLLAPMMVMLIIVFVIILIPAFISFRL